MSVLQSASPSRATVHRLQLVLAFTAIYIVWGSTYLAIRYAVESVPPLLMAGGRNVAAGGILYAWLRWRGVPSPSAAEWRPAVLVGALLFLCGAGTLAWAERRVASGLASLVFATIPLWTVMLAAACGRERPGRRSAVGVGLGLAGVATLVGVRSGDGAGALDPLSTVVLLGGSLAWAAGSMPVLGRRLPGSRAMAAAAPMLAGGALLVAVGLLAGEGVAFSAPSVSLRSALALGYLTGAGSLLGFTATPGCSPTRLRSAWPPTPL